MDLTQYLRGIGRRWKVILAAVLVALAVGWYLSPEETVAAPRSTSYQATTYLLSTGVTIDVRSGASNIDTVATLATLGEVPRRVAEAIDYEGDPATLVSSVTVEPDQTTQFLTITARAETAPRARLIADTFAEQLLEFLRSRSEERVSALQAELDRLDRQIARLEAQLPDGRTDTTDTRDETTDTTTDEAAQEQANIEQEIQRLEFDQQFVQTEYSQLVSASGGDLAGFEIVEPAIATPIGPDEGLQAPRSRAIRLLIAGAIGLLLGLALALILERFDTRLRSKSATEEAYGLPVLAVIPTIGRRGRGTIVTETAPRSAVGNAFRLLEAALQLGRQDSAAHAAGNGQGGAPKTIVVTSGEPREGKSTVVANLAATFADVGKRVVVVCCDFRHPSLHATFNVGHEPGLTDALQAEGADLEALIQDTAIAGVGVLANGAVPDKPGNLFGSDRMGEVLAGLRSIADVVLIDTSPVLAASDWTQMIPHVDAVVLVARAGKTDAGSARRTADVLLLLQAPVLGVVLNAVPRGFVSQATDRSWYRYQAPDRRPPRPVKEPASEPLVTVADAPEGSNGRVDAAAEDRDEGIPHLARPGRED